MGGQMARHVSAGIGALLLAIVVLGPVTASAAGQAPAPGERPRAREAGIVIGSLPTGPLNALVDVRGVAVGHATVTEGDAVHTGVTAIRSEEHTSELQSRENLVCRLRLEKKNE